MYKPSKEQNWKNQQKYNTEIKFLATKKKLKYQQWKKTNAAIKWLRYFNNKGNSKFIQMDIKGTINPLQLFIFTNVIHCSRL